MWQRGCWTEIAKLIIYYCLTYTRTTRFWSLNWPRQSPFNGAGSLSSTEPNGQSNTNCLVLIKHLMRVRNHTKMFTVILTSMLNCLMLRRNWTVHLFRERLAQYTRHLSEKLFEWLQEINPKLVFNRAQSSEFYRSAGVAYGTTVNLLGPFDP